MRFSLASALFFGAALVAAGTDDVPASRTHSLSRDGNNQLKARGLSTRAESCTGKFVTCVSCFGAGYRECPGDSTKCYNPDVPQYSTCSTSGSGGSGGTTGGSSGGSETCSGKGVTCVSCFGAGYKECPNDSTKCYNPNVPQYSTCSTSGSGGSGGSGSSGPSDESCARQYGAGNKLCGKSSCYDPTAGETCCSNTGSHCDRGKTCSKSGTLCCAPGSKNPDCIGNSSGNSSTSSTSTTSSYSYQTPTSNGNSIPSSTNILGSGPTSSPDTPQRNSAACMGAGVLPLLAGGLGMIAAL